MKKRSILLVLCCMLLLSACGAAKEEKSADQAAAEDVTEARTETKEAERLSAQVVVIGGSEEGLKAALGAVKGGAETVLVLAGGEAMDKTLLTQVEEAPQITLLSEATVSGLLMDSTGAMRAVNSKQNGETVGIDCMSVILAVDPNQEENAGFLSFLLKNESGGLMVDSSGCPQRDMNPEQAPPTKCGVPLAVGGSEEKEDSGPQYVAIPGLYAVGAALEGNEISLSSEEIGAAAAKIVG